ncbi:MAG: hypothetical protein Q7S01_04885 [bacterium]|nr:hypothetical protein [bacterium]
MNQFLQMDIFFFISSVASVVLAILASILLFYSIKAAKNLYGISEGLKGDYTETKEFLSELRDRLENNLIFRIFFPTTRRKKKEKS